MHPMHHPQQCSAACQPLGLSQFASCRCPGPGPRCLGSSPVSLLAGLHRHQQQVTQQLSTLFAA